METTRRGETCLAVQGYQRIVGIDEAGRGPLAGPVVAAAVHLPTSSQIKGIADSKKLRAGVRQYLCQQICDQGIVGIGEASPSEIDEVNILHATFMAMRRAVAGLPRRPDYCLVDGNQPIPNLGIDQECVVQGDSTCYLIAAASIVAKVHRDHRMEELDQLYPKYGLAKHKGYPTKEHLAALRKFGPTPEHRISFSGVKRGVVS